MKKKLLAILLTAIASAAILTGCTSNSDSGSEGGDSSEEGGISTGITKYKEDGVTLKWWIVGGTAEYYQHYFSEMKGLQKIQEETGITIDFDVQTNEDNYLPMMTAGNFPDIVTAKNMEMFPGRLDKLYLDGISKALNPYIEEYMPNFKQILINYPTIAKDLQISSGEYTFASTLYDVEDADDRAATSVYGLAIRKDWLDSVGMGVPTNMAEWFDVLMAFKSMDPNANGELDEVPICMASSGWKYFLVGYGIGDDPILDENGKVFYGYTTPQYRDYLAEMNKWYNESLFDNWFKHATLLDREEVVTNNTAGAWKADADHFDVDDLNSYISTLRQTVPAAEFAACPWPETADGKLYCYSNIASFHRDTTIVTTNCTNPEAACWLIDSMYSEEGSNLLSWGIEGESYTVVNGEKEMMEGMDDDITYYDTTIKQRYTYADPTTIGFPKFKTFASCILSTKSDGYVEACRVWAEGDTSYRMPYAAQLNDLQSAEVENTTENMKGYLSEMRQKFVEGTEPLTSYDKYVDQCKLYGSEEYERIWQECYDAYAARKGYSE